MQLIENFDEKKSRHWAETLLRTDEDDNCFRFWSFHRRGRTDCTTGTVEISAQPDARAFCPDLAIMKLDMS